MTFFFIICLFCFLSCRSFAISPFRLRALRSQNKEKGNNDKTIRFSILAKPTSNITSDDFLYSDQSSFIESEAYDVYTSVVDVTTKLLCQKTDFQMIVDGRDSCSSNNNLSTNANNATQFLADLNKVDVMVRDASYTVIDKSHWVGGKQQQANITIQWLEFIIHYPILQTDSDTNNSKAIAYDIAQNKIRKAIDDNTFAKKLRQKGDIIIAVANVGDESEVFSPWAQIWESLTSTNTNTTTGTPPKTHTVQQQQSFSFNDFFYPMRIAGLILLGITIFIVTFMICLAEKRKKLREEQVLTAEEGNGALHTNEGLNAMLDVGREVTLRRRMNQIT